MKKLLMWALIVIPVILIIAIVIVAQMVDGIVKRTIETQATASTNLTTTLDSASISLFGGNAALKDLKIASPKGFSTPTMFEMKDLEVAVSYRQLTDDPIRIKRIVINEPKLVIEHHGGKINVKTAMDEMPPSEPSTLRLIIDALEIRNTNIVVKPGLPFLKPVYSVTIPPLTLHNVGNADGSLNGAAIKEVLTEVLNTAVDKLKESDTIPEDMKQWLVTSTGDLKSAVKQEIGTQKQKYIDEAKEKAGEKLQKGLQDLLGGKKQ